jgi:hypothetical protein
MLLVAKSCLALESVDAKLDRSSSELGKPVNLVITADDSKQDLSALPLDELRDTFAIGSRDYTKELLDTDTRTTISRQQLRLQLYPRRKGKLTAPSIRIGKRFTREIPLDVVAAKHKGKPIDVDWQLSQAKTWQREQVMVRIRITTPEEFATLELQNEEVHGFEITPLPVTRANITDNANKRTVLTTGWSVLPLLPGTRTLALPAIEYHSDGVRRRLFYLPTIKLTVRPLPSYLPPTIPVGKIEVNSRVSPEKIHYPGEVAYWNITLTSQSLPPYWLPPVLRQVKSDKNVEFLPASSKRELRPDKTGVNGSVQHSIPFKILKNGVAELPALNIQYFDTETGKIISTGHQPEKLLAVSLPVRLLLAVLLLATLAWSGYLIIGRLIGYYHYYRQYRVIARRLQDVSGIDQLSEILGDISRAESWPDNISLSSWLSHWQKNFGRNDELAYAVHQLSRIKYSRPRSHTRNVEHEESAAIGHAINRAIITRKRRRKSPMDSAVTTNLRQLLE